MNPLHDAGTTARTRPISPVASVTRPARAASAKKENPGGQRDKALAVIAHELRQPLSVIRVNAAVLQRLPEATASLRIRSIAQAIERAIESQTRIIDDLLEFSRVRIGKLTLQRTPVDLVALLTELVENFSANLAACPVRLESLPCESLVCHADPVRLQQIAGNLLANAVKFTPARGQVTVRLSAEDGYARLMVADTGQGIAPEFLPHVFGLFQQADAGAMRQGGLGVGLALVQGLVLAHGGFVEAKSEGVGRGAEFNVWLPLLRQADK